MKKVMGIVASICILLIPSQIFAKEEGNTTNVVISFALTKEDRFVYEVKVTKGGYLFDGSQKITNGTMAYELSVGESKNFTIQPERGYEIKKIINNGSKVQANGKEIRITGVSTNSVLEVIYGKIEEPLIPDIPDTPDVSIPPDNTNTAGNTYPGSSNQGNEIDVLIPITGDMLKISEYVCLMLIVLYRVYISKKQRVINVYTREDKIAIDIAKEEKIEEEKKDEK